MRRNHLALLALVLATVTFAGCRTSPVRNVTDAPVVGASETPTREQVRNAIINAGNSLGWSMKEEQPGQILGTLYLRDHVAVVEIPYDSKKYSINYKDSSNLKYDGSEIHSNYNGWVQNLDNAIKRQLNTL